MNIKIIVRRSFLSLLVLVMALTTSGCFSLTQSIFYVPADDVMYDYPERHGYFYEDVYFTSKDGTKINGRFFPAQKNINGTQTRLSAKGTVIHYHGNAENITAQGPFVGWLPGRGFNVFVFDYRGYGKSIGEATPKGLYYDSNSALDYLRTRNDIDPNKILVFGQSLGGNNAISVVGSGNKAGVKAVVIDSTFYSYSAMVGQYSLVARLFANNDYSANKLIAGIAPIPLLMLHGTSDNVIPFDHGERLFALAKEPKQFYAVKNGQHLDGVRGKEAQKYQDIIAQFFEQALEQAP